MKALLWGLLRILPRNSIELSRGFAIKLSTSIFAAPARSPVSE